MLKLMACLGALASSGFSQPQPVSDEKLSQEEKTVAVHLMPSMSPGAEYVKPAEHVIGWRPSAPGGPLATYAPEYLSNYRNPKMAAKKDVEKIREMGANAVGICYNMPGNSALRPDQFHSIFNAYYQACVEDGNVKFFPDIWGLFRKDKLDTNIENLANEFAYIKEHYEKGWLKKDGKYVIFVYPFSRPETLPPVGDFIEKLTAKMGGTNSIYLVMYSGRQFSQPDSFFGNAPQNPEWFSASSAFSTWPNESYGFARKQLSEDLDFSSQTGKKFWLTLFPAFTQARGWPDGPWNVREMLGVANFMESWKQAIRNKVHDIYLLTWNDLTEDSSFMPESNHGYAYYELAKYFNKWFLEGSKPEITNEQVLLFHHPQVVEGLQVPPGIRPMEGFPVAAGFKDPLPRGNFNSPPVNRTPPTDFIAAVAMLKAPATLRIMLNEKLLAERELPAGVHSWLIYQPRYLNDPRHWYPCDDNAYPTESDDFFITKLTKPFFDSEVYVEIVRDGKRLGFFQSHRPIADAAGRGDMSTVGDVFVIDR